nr:LysE family transporter [Acinetobacter sp. Marseille-Q1620]
MSLLLTICALHFIAQLSPGPDVLLVAKSAASTSKTHTLQIILGISIGVVVWVTLTLLGFTVLLEQWPWIQQILMLVGGLFLAKMGYAMLKGGLSSLKSQTVLEGSLAHQKNYFLMGLFTNLANPKILIYFSSVFSLALSSTASANLKPYLAVIIPVQTFVVFAGLMMIMSIPKIKTLYQRSGGYIDILSGILFLFFAVFLWFDAIKML